MCGLLTRSANPLPQELVRAATWMQTSQKDGHGKQGGAHGTECSQCARSSLSLFARWSWFQQRAKLFGRGRIHGAQVQIALGKG